MKREILHVLFIGEAVLFLIIFLGFSIILFKLSSKLWKIAHGDTSFGPKPPLRITYKIPQAFGRYSEQRDGWKMYLPWLAQLTVFSAFGCLGYSLMTLQFHFGYFFIIFFGTGFMLFGMMVFQRNYDRSISFYREGIGNRPKGHKTPYDFYSKAIIENIYFENSKFRAIKFIPKRITWQTIPSEYGFNANDDISPLIALLKEQGLPIEER